MAGPALYMGVVDTGMPADQTLVPELHHLGR